MTNLQNVPEDGAIQDLCYLVLNIRLSSSMHVYDDLIRAMRTLSGAVTTVELKRSTKAVNIDPMCVFSIHYRIHNSLGFTPELVKI